MTESVNGNVAIGVIQNQGDYLLVRRSENNSSSGKWAFPGGKIEDEETISEAVKREIKEETGLEAEIQRKGESYENRGELGLWKIYPVLLKSESRNVELDHEHDDYEWIKISDLDKFDTLGEMKAVESLEL